MCLCTLPSLLLVLCPLQVERIMKAAVECNVCLIPFGGGTNVSRALECPPDETRTIVSLDMTTMVCCKSHDVM